MSESATSERRRLPGGKIDAIGSGLFFIWTGVAVIGGVGWAAALIGVATILFVAQAARYFAGEPADVLMTICGLLLLVAAIWVLAAISWSPVGVLLIGIGTVILASSLLRRLPGQTPVRGAPSFIADRLGTGPPGPRAPL